MDYLLNQQLPSTSDDCIVVGLWASSTLPQSLTILPQSIKNTLVQLQKNLDAQRTLLWQTDCDGCQLLVIHCGEQDKYTPDVLSKLMQAIANALLKQRVHTASIYMPPLPAEYALIQLEQMLLQMDAACYQLLTFKHDPPDTRQTE